MYHQRHRLQSIGWTAHQRVTGHISTIIRFRDHPPKLCKRQHRLQRSPVGLKGHHHDHPCFFFPQPLQLPLHSPVAHLLGLMGPSNALRVTNMSHFVHSGRGCLHSFRTNSVSHTWWCTKWTCSALWIMALPGHPPTSQAMEHVVYGKDIRWVLELSGGWWGCPPGRPGPPHDLISCGNPSILPTGLCCTRVSGPSGGTVTGSVAPPLPSVGRKPLQSGPQERKNADKP